MPGRDNRTRVTSQDQETCKGKCLGKRFDMKRVARCLFATIVGEKTPSHALHIKALSEAFPLARFLILRRDPRAVVASWHRTTWSRRTTTEVSEKWRRYSTAMRRALVMIPKRCHEIGYEELVSNPTAVLKSCCAFLGSDFDPGMLFYHERDMSSFDERVDNELTFEPPNASRIDAWRIDTPAPRLRRIEAICGREMTRFGYGRDTSLRERIPTSIVVLPNLWRKRIRRKLRGRRVENARPVI